MKIKKIALIISLNMIMYGLVFYGASTVTMLTGQGYMNTAVAWQVVSLIDRGMTVWSVLGLFAGLNVVGVGVLFAVKQMVGKLSKAAIVAW